MEKAKIDRRVKSEKKNIYYSMSIKFSVIIPTHKRPDDLKNCILSVLRQDLSAECFELIVVDNDKKGSAEDVVKKINSNKIKIRYEKRSSNNVSESRNLGAKLAEGLWLAFLDDDCIADSNWLFHAEQLILAYQSRGLIIGGGYKKGGSDSFGDIAKAEILPNNLYLVEGNCFYLKKEYLEIGGMRSDLGPSDKRFGYHEGSELQDRYKKHYGHDSLRILDKKIAVTHLARKKAKKWLSVVSGYDSIVAFEKNKKISYSGNIIRGIGCLLRFSFYSIRSKNDLCLRELYRFGEIFGEISLRAQTQYRNLTSLLRRLNNQTLGKTTNNNLSLKTACLNDLVAMLKKGLPFNAGKIGGAELMALEYVDHWIRPNWPKQWSWRRPATRLSNNAGFFPIERKEFNRWHEIMSHAISESDFLCLWQTDPFLKIYEYRLISSLAPDCRNIPMKSLGRSILPSIAPFRWLVVSPFVKTMKYQLPHLRQVHDFTGEASIDWMHIEKTCQFIRCPFQSHLEPTPYDSWEDGLDKLATEVASKEFDVALIGAGAWSLPLGGRIKQMGKCAIHMGGEMQLLFGIKGKRWEDRNIYNESWIRPFAEDTPTDVNRVEDGCYW